MAGDPHHTGASLQALREDAIAICRQAGWSPRCLGQQGAKPGVTEIYEELRCLQHVLAVDVAQALIDCCRMHQQWTPLFEDVEARIALFQGEVQNPDARLGDQVDLIEAMGRLWVAIGSEYGVGNYATAGSAYVGWVTRP